MSACAGKERFTTFGMAEVVAKRSNTRHAGYRLHAYRCGDCGGFHVGSSVGHGKGRGARNWRYLETEGSA